MNWWATARQCWQEGWRPWRLRWWPGGVQLGPVTVGYGVGMVCWCGTPVWRRAPRSAAAR